MHAERMSKTYQQCLDNLIVGGSYKCHRHRYQVFQRRYFDIHATVDEPVSLAKLSKYH